MHGRYEVFSGERIVVLVTIVKIHHYILLVIIMPSCTTDQCEDLEITLIRLFIHNKFCLFPRHAQCICHRLPSVCKTLHSCAICYCRSTNFCRDTCSDDAVGSFEPGRHSTKEKEKAKEESIPLQGL